MECLQMRAAYLYPHKGTHKIVAITINQSHLLLSGSKLVLYGTIYKHLTDSSQIKKTMLVIDGATHMKDIGVDVEVYENVDVYISVRCGIWSLPAFE